MVQRKYIQWILLIMWREFFFNFFLRDKIFKKFLYTISSLIPPLFKSHFLPYWQGWVIKHAPSLQVFWKNWNFPKVRFRLIQGGGVIKQLMVYNFTILHKEKICMWILEKRWYQERGCCFTKKNVFNGSGLNPASPSPYVPQNTIWCKVFFNEKSSSF